MPNMEASTPPINGPITLPAVKPDCSMPRLIPNLPTGTEEVAIARHTDHSPAANPCKTRTPTICSGLVTIPPNKYDNASPRPLRIAMGFLPWVSAILPHTGAIMPPIKKVTENTTPDHMVTSLWLTPSSRTRYIGKNGISIV